MSVYLNENSIYGEAPASQRERQEFFLGLLRDFGLSHMSYAVVTFGCQMNSRDSEKLAGMLEKAGCTEAEREENADVVIFNTCTVRENANEHLYGRLGRLKKAHKDRPDMIIAVCGCMMQEADEALKLRRSYPYVDLIFGTHNLHTLPELLYRLLMKRRAGIPLSERSAADILIDSSDDDMKLERLLRYGADNKKEIRKLSGRPVISVWKDSSEIVENIPSKRKFAFRQGINIMYGCDNFCTYCIVPYVRGREKSRNSEDIYDEVKRLGRDGVKEIMLLGQNVNSYDGGIGFARLLSEVDSLAGEYGIERVRFMTSHPKDLSDELIDVMAKGERICAQFHLPLQSGSDRILRKMNRHYTAEKFVERAEALKARVPGISLSTDIIVGFPTETEEDFGATLSILRKVRFDFAYTFIYSKREGTPAARIEDDQDPKKISERFSRLIKLQNSITAENLTSRLGSCEKVLFENVSEYDSALVSGKTEGGATVHVPGDSSLIGHIYETLLTECRGFYYMGRLSG